MKDRGSAVGLVAVSAALRGLLCVALIGDSVNSANTALASPGRPLVGDIVRDDVERFAHGLPVQVALATPEDGSLDFAFNTRKDDRFAVGSVGKSITAAIALGLFSTSEIEGPIADIAPGIPGGATVRTRDLLLHSSGYQDVLSAAPQDLSECAFSVLLALPLAFAPGSEMRYSSTDYIVLAKLIEKKTGAEISTVFLSFFERAGMRNSALLQLPVTVPAAALFPAESGQVTIDVPDFIGTGGVLAPASDIVKFDEFFFSQRDLLQRLNSLTMVLPGSSTEVPGWFVARRGASDPEYWHDGAFPGYSAVNIAIPSRKTFIAITARGKINAYLAANTILDDLGI
ncbi:MAG TPA: serine hydrolase domain-containing protein [Candidatus Sulfotelmatobacter sp.]|nr:serine hydrolase domain-containing protein [Candidatus Sulfotelmatobacter sp.]